MDSTSSVAGSGAGADSAAAAPRAQYPIGHQDAVLRSHRWRTVDNSAAYAVNALREAFASGGSDATLLDVGCGPGTITVGFGELTAPTGGRVVGIDFASGVLEEARTLAAEKGVSDHTTFETGDALRLRWSDGSLVAAHAHQVLIHLSDPVGALREMRRVLRPSGSVLAVREGDFGTIAIHPHSDVFALWLDVWNRVARAAGAEPNAGRRLKSWALSAGFKEEQMTMTCGTFCYSTPAERRWWGELWAERSAGASSPFAQSALEGGHATRDQLDAIAAAWRHWSQQPDATFIMAHGELLVRQ